MNFEPFVVFDRKTVSYFFANYQSARHWMLPIFFIRSESKVINL